jgi:hypothetical protein
MSYRGDHLGFQVDKKKTHTHTHFIKSNQRDFPLRFFLCQMVLWFQIRIIHKHFP